MNLKTLLFFCLVSLFFSCKESAISVSRLGGEENFVFDFDRIQTEDISYQIDKFIPLETTQSNFLSENLMVKITSEFIFVFDEDIRGAIHQFDLEGRYISKIISVGEGPDQVSNIEDFIVSEKSIEILSGKGAYSEIVYYSIDEKKITGKLKLELIGFSFEKLGDTYFIYSSYNFPFVEYRVSKIDLDGKIRDNYLKNDYSGSLMPVVERNFFTSHEKTYLIESFNNRIYEITPDQLKTKYQIDFGRYNISKEFFEQDMMSAFERLSQEGFYNILNHFEGKNFAFTTVVFQKENITQVYQVFFTKDKEEVVKQKLNSPLGDVFRHPVGITDSDLLIFSVSPMLLLKNAELLNSNLELKKEDNPVLIFMKILN